MELLKNNFEEIKKTNDPEIINDFLINLSKDPDKGYLRYVEYFKNNLDPRIFEKVKLNMIYLLGEIGKLTNIEKKFINLLKDTYYSSDRWIRNEIIQAIGKISTNLDITEDIINLLGYAVNDDYFPIKVNALQVILNLNELPAILSKNIFQALSVKNTELESLCIKILDKFIPDYNQLFFALNFQDNYKILKKHAIRALLLTYFRSVLNLESFRQKISNSNWENEYIENFLKEIDIYEKIIMKKL
ncbi:MAG: HEAT repeat domain-containing protein [Promethearchaeota archaeon]